MTTPAEPAIATPIRTRVRDAVARAWAAAVAGGTLPSAPTGESSSPLPEVEIERPANPDHGDLATNLAMRLARPYRRSPLEIANALAAAIERDLADPGSDSPIASVDVAPPGFLNLRLADRALEATIAGIVSDPDAWGRVPPVRPRRVNV
jgi:arginyl-tRNA synthetase